MAQLGKINIVEKTFANGVQAIKGLQFNLEQGEFLALVGPSGAGKTTLLNIIAGLDQDFSGSIDFLNQTTPRCGFMFQESRLLPWLNVCENIAIVTQALPSNMADNARNQIDELLDLVGLGDFQQAYPKQLSIGMQRRVSMLRAFIVRPDLLLMDEPFQSLDQPTVADMHRLLLSLWQETGASVLFVTHDLREAITLADRILFLAHRPTKVIYEYKIEQKHPDRMMDSDGVNALHQALLAKHPNLLSGELAG